MEFLKDFFDGVEDGKLSYEELKQAVEAEGMKLVNLSEGGYVSKQKHEDEMNARAKEIETLKETIGTRDTDLADLQAKLEAAGTDAEKLGALTNDFTSLKSKYEEDVKAYKGQLKKQAYEFAVREYANGKDFTSQAAKRDFINEMISKDLKVEDGKIIGADDFVAIYTQNNADAFKVAEPDPDPEPEPFKPQFVAPTDGDHTVDPTGGFASAFHFTPIHPIPES